jgi:hypothetical protein
MAAHICCFPSYHSLFRQQELEILLEMTTHVGQVVLGGRQRCAYHSIVVIGDGTMIVRYAVLARMSDMLAKRFCRSYSADRAYARRTGRATLLLWDGQHFLNVRFKPKEVRALCLYYTANILDASAIVAR